MKMKRRKSLLKKVFLRKKKDYIKTYSKPDHYLKDDIYLSCSGNDAWTDYILKLIND